MNLAVDWTRCDGHGHCALLAPELIARDEWGYPLVRPGPLLPGTEKDARRAVAACPALALRIDPHPDLPGRTRP